MSAVDQILLLASKGVWIKDIHEELGDEFIRAEITTAIREAREKGMYSIPDMRDDRGTYYQYDSPIESTTTGSGHDGDIGS